MSHIGYIRDRAQQRAAALWEARYDGECPECDGRIRVGDLVRWEGSDVAHVDCPSADAPLIERQPRDLDARLADGLRGWGA